jgi:hypothetical protein
LVGSEVGGRFPDVDLGDKGGDTLLCESEDLPLDTAESLSESSDLTWIDDEGATLAGLRSSIKDFLAVVGLEAVTVLLLLYTVNGFRLKAGEYFGMLLLLLLLFFMFFHGGVDRTFVVVEAAAIKEAVEAGDSLLLSWITRPFILVKVFRLLWSIEVLADPRRLLDVSLLSVTTEAVEAAMRPLELSDLKCGGGRGRCCLSLLRVLKFALGSLQPISMRLWDRPPKLDTDVRDVVAVEDEKGVLLLPASDPVLEEILVRRA